MSQINSLCPCILGFFFLSSVYVKAQFNYSFLKYLSDKNLSLEHKSYLARYAGTLPKDSIAYLEAKYYLQYFNDSLFLESYKKSNFLWHKDTGAYNRAGIAFLQSKKKNLWFSNRNDSLPQTSKEIFRLYQSITNPTQVDMKDIPEDFRSDFLDYQRHYSRKPFLAAALSTMVPGLGELYAGRRRSFIITLVSNLVYAVQAYEACHKLGVKNTFSILSIGFFGVFYFANIYGSYDDTKKVINEKKQQVFNDAAHFYDINSTSKLYQ